MEESNFIPAVGAFVEAAEENMQCVKSRRDCNDTRSGVVNGQYVVLGGGDFLFDSAKLGDAV